MKSEVFRNVSFAVMVCAAVVAFGATAKARDEAQFSCQGGALGQQTCTQISGDPLECSNVNDATCTKICVALELGNHGVLPSPSCSNNPLTFDCVCGNIDD